MTVIVCVDNKNGMLFNHRRQSSDQNLLNFLFQKFPNQKLHIRPFSEKLFSAYADRVIVDENFSQTDHKTVCFVEDVDVAQLQFVEKLIVCKWNRAYPSDFRLTVDLSAYSLANTTDIVGHSHDKITIQEYMK